MRKITGVVIPFLFQHLLCCGAFLFFLMSSGYLLMIRQEADKKLFLLPAIVATALLIGLYWHYNRCCRSKGNNSMLSYGLLFLLYILISFVVGILFMIYIFIPWWIPNYKGGPLLP